MAPLITADKVNVWYNGLHAAKDISLDIRVNSITALIGASGSGKSTFLRCMNRMVDVISSARFEGVIRYKGENILSPKTDVITLRKSIGMVFQNPVPFPKSIYDNIAYGLEIQGHPNPRKTGLFSISKISAQEVEQSEHPTDRAVVKSLKEAALWEEVKHRLHASAFSLSGGQQQRLCIARAIAVRPEVLLLDEPCSELDPISTRKIETLLLELKERYTIVIVTHNMRQARRISDTVGFFHLGELIEYASNKELFDHPQKQLTQEYVSGAFG
ncbi:MAG: phosphate ABC transporter ATP-binding protein [Patescibacteria group bacterium]